MKPSQVFPSILSLLALSSLAGSWNGARAQESAAPVAARNLDRLIQIVEELDERRKGLQTVVARLKVVLHDQAHDRNVTLDGAYLGDSHGNVRLRIKHAETVVIDLAFRDETVELWLPLRERFLRGTRREVLMQGNNDLTLLAVAGNAPDLFFPRAWTPRATERRARMENGRPMITVLEGDGATSRRVRQLLLSPTELAIEQQDILGLGGRVLGSISYADYRFPGPRAGATAGTPYPGRLTLSSKTEQRSLEMIVEELHINTPIPPNKFAVEVPTEQKVLPLVESLGSGKSLWE